MDSKKILVVDDDPGLRELLQEYLSSQGFQVHAVADGAAMERHLAQAAPDLAPDLVILDLMLPGEDGLALARKVKAQSDLPIIMLSARGEDVDRIVGLEVGADDYLSKPFNPRELLARIRAVLRRGGGEAAPREAPGKQPLHRFGAFQLNPASRTLLKDGAEVKLTAREFNLLSIFVDHPNRVLSRDFLIDAMKGYERDPFDRSVDVTVTRLRRKIEEDPASPAYVRTVWGEGYLFAPDGAA